MVLALGTKAVGIERMEEYCSYNYFSSSPWKEQMYHAQDESYKL